MSLPEIVSRDEWLAARTALLAREKEFTRLKDQLNADRRRLPMVRVDEDYVFTGPQGTLRLVDMFGDSRQLVVQHVMFGPDWDEPCPACSAGLDEMSDGLLRHLQARDTAFAAIARAPIDKITEARARKGWTIDWYSSYGSDFNYDFHVTLDESVTPIEYNYRDRAELAAAGMDWLTQGPSEQPGMSCFLRDGTTVYHTYSTFGRGTEQLGGGYAFLDMTALGRQEEWEEPKGRAAGARKPIPDFAE